MACRHGATCGSSCSERDGWRCRLKGDGCTTQATQVDHIVSPREGGAFYDPVNLRAACKACNASRGATARLKQGWRLAATDVVVDKGTAATADERARLLERRGAALVDRSTLAVALNSDELADIVRRLIVTAIRRGELAGVDRVVVVCETGG